VLEAPANSESYFVSPGTQSLIFALAGCDVTLVHSDPAVVVRTRQAWRAAHVPLRAAVHHADMSRLPFDDGSFDLAWNFDAIPMQPDPAAAVAELARVSRKLVMVIVPNSANIGYPVHRAAGWLRRRESLWGAHLWMNGVVVAGAMRAAGLRVTEVGFVDMPPWPGGDAIARRMRTIREVRIARTLRAADGEAEQMLQRLTFIERSKLPLAVKRLFAHQIYLVARKADGERPA
jgi:SAM-dependent methyltransferase